MNLTVRNRIIIFISALFIIGGALTYFYIYPCIINNIEFSQNMNTTRIGIEKKYLSGQYLRRATQDIEKVKSSAKSLSNIFIFTGEEYLFIPEFEKIMTTAGYAISETDLSEDELLKNKKSTNDILHLSFIIQGQFSDLMNALKDSQVINQYINIDNIEISTLENSSLQMKVKARMYRINPEKIINVFSEDDN